MWGTALVAGLTIGILGSLHCVGMCGPLALSIPFPTTNRIKRVLGILTYNLGRVVTYMMIGIVFGWIGLQFTLFGWQQILSLVLGVFLLLIALGTIFHKRIIKISAVNRWWNKLFGKTFGRLLSKGTFGSLFVIGILNGLLPCGLVYVALAGALATGEVITGAVFMMGFGLATLPAMMTVSLAGGLIKAKWQHILRKASPYVIALMACLLILRGLNLNIPYLSPQLQDESIQCCDIPT